MTPTSQLKTPRTLYPGSFYLPVKPVMMFMLSILSQFAGTVADYYWDYDWLMTIFLGE